MILKEASLPAKIRELKVERINQIWGNAKLRSVRMKREKPLPLVAKNRVRSQNALETDCWKTMRKYNWRMAGLKRRIEEKVKEIPVMESWGFMELD